MVPRALFAENQRVKNFVVHARLASGRYWEVWLASDWAQRPPQLAVLKLATGCAARDEFNVFDLNVGHIFSTLCKETRPTLSSLVRGAELLRDVAYCHSYLLQKDGASVLCGAQKFLGPTLFELAADGRVVPFALLSRAANDLLSTLHFLHSQLRLIHCDIKPDNIFAQTASLFLPRAVLSALLLILTHDWEGSGSSDGETAALKSGAGLRSRCPLTFGLDSQHPGENVLVVTFALDELRAVRAQCEAWLINSQFANEAAGSDEAFLQRPWVRELLSTAKCSNLAPNFSVSISDGTVRIMSHDFSQSAEIDALRAVLQCKSPINCRLSDFTCAVFADSVQTPPRAIANYAPPEAFLCDQMSFAADIWSLGVVFYELASGQHFLPRSSPWSSRCRTYVQLLAEFKEHVSKRLFRHLKKRNCAELYRRRRKTCTKLQIHVLGSFDAAVEERYPNSAESEALREFVRAALVLDASKRPTASELLRLKLPGADFRGGERVEHFPLLACASGGARECTD